MVSNPDIVVCTETWLSSSIPLEAVAIPGYHCHRTDRMNDSGRGGVAIWTKVSLRAEKLSFPLFDNVEICVVQSTVSKLVIAGMYLPPGIASDPFTEIGRAHV